MPIYEYRCSECGFQDEFLQKHSEPQLTVCPSCKKETFKKLLSAAGFQLKGSGWYATDFKSSGSKPVAKSEGEGKPAADKPAETSGDKPAEKASETSSDKGTAAAKAVPASTSG